MKNESRIHHIESDPKYKDIEMLLFALTASGKKYDIEKIKRAYLYAAKLHEGQFRASGEKYIFHPIAVAEIAVSLGLDTDSICAALLHDTVEDCGSKVSLEEIESEFGSDVSMLVDGLTKLVHIPFEDKEEKHIENLRKMFLAMSRDIRVIFIKLCDRLHNMRTLGAKKPDLAKEYGRTCRLIGAGIAVCLVAIYLFGGRWLYSLFFEEQHIIEIGVSIIHVIIFVVIFQICQVIYMGCLRGAGDTLYTAVASMISVTFIRTIVSYLGGYTLGLGIVGIWFGVLADQMSRFIFATIRFKQGKWVKIKI